MSYLGGYDLYDDSEPIHSIGSQHSKKAEEEKSPQQLMEESVKKARPERWTQLPTICEVPTDLAEGNKGSYTPKVVCIGPLFESKRRTADMLWLERYKWSCIRKLIMESHPAGSLEPADWSPDVHGKVFHECYDEMKRLVPRIRASYCSSSSSTDTSGCGSNDDDLARNMLLDGGFVLNRLFKYARMAKSSSRTTTTTTTTTTTKSTTTTTTTTTGLGGMDGHDDYDYWTQVFVPYWIWGSVRRDILLLSNQVPFFVIRKLFEHLKSNDSREDNVLVPGSLRLFSSLHPRRMHATPIACGDVHHLLHLFYLSIDLPSSPSMNDHPESIRALPSSELSRLMPSAKELEEAGVPIRQLKDGAKSFLDVRFSDGVLEIPPLHLYDYSETLFRNLIAFEHTYPATDGRVTAYAEFMNCLLKTTRDVRVLRRSKVLVNHLNGERDDAAMEFFSRICTEADSSADCNYLSGVMNEVARVVERYQSERWPRWRAALLNNYFSNPWVTTSVVVAAFLLALTVLQSFYSVYGYYKPPS